MIGIDQSQAVLAERVDRSLNRLPPRRRNILLLNRVDGWTYAEIAAAYGISERRVRRHVTIAMTILIREVLHDEPQPWWRRWSP